jgi:hypothetical protein
LCHNSNAIHRAYARKEQVGLPSLESYESQNVDGRIGDPARSRAVDEREYIKQYRQVVMHFHSSTLKGTTRICAARHREAGKQFR